MNIDAKILNKILVTKSKRLLKGLLYHNQIESILGNQRYLNIKK